MSTILTAWTSSSAENCCNLQEIASWTKGSVFILICFFASKNKISSFQQLFYIALESDLNVSRNGHAASVLASTSDTL